MDEVVGCSVCMQQPAAVFCLCQPMPTCLCHEHIPKHCEQVASSLHDFCTMKDWGFAKSISIEGYKKRKLSIAQGIALVETLQTQEQKDYADAVLQAEQLMQQVKFLIDSMHATLSIAFDALKQNIQTALYEERQPEMIDFVMRNGQVMQALRLNLFDIQAVSSLKGCLNLVSSTIAIFQTQDFASYILTKMKEEFLRKGDSPLSTAAEGPESYIPVLKHNILRKYFANDTGRLSLIEYAYSTKVGKDSSYALMQSGELFCCGGGSPGKQSYFIGTHSSKVTILPLMCHGRSCPGVISYNNTPYVFGGRNGSLSLNSCERFNSVETWELFPHGMSRPRCSFSPVIYNSLIYLPGGVITNVVEVFDPVKMSFRQLVVNLPFQGENLSFVHADTLYVLNESNLAMLDLRNESSPIRRSSLKTEIVSWSPIAPIVTGGKVLFWGFEDISFSNFFRRTFTNDTHGICYSYDIAKSVLKQIERFQYSEE